jgi:hypothetical protein
MAIAEQFAHERYSVVRNVVVHSPLLVPASGKISNRPRPIGSILVVIVAGAVT